MHQQYQNFLLSSIYEYECLWNRRASYSDLPQQFFLYPYAYIGFPNLNPSNRQNPLRNMFLDSIHPTQLPRHLHILLPNRYVLSERWYEEDCWCGWCVYMDELWANEWRFVVWFFPEIFPKIDNVFEMPIIEFISYLSNFISVCFTLLKAWQK